MTDTIQAVRDWHLKVEEQTDTSFTLEAQVLCMVEEASEYLTSFADEDRVDAIGDTAVTAIVAFELAKRLPGAEEFGYGRIEDVGVTMPMNLSREEAICGLYTHIGHLAEGVRKKRTHQTLRSAAVVYRFTQQLAKVHGYMFYQECLEPVVDILYSRLDAGYKMVGGSAIKTEDQA